MPAGDMGDRLMEGNPVTKQMETDSSFRNKNFHPWRAMETPAFTPGRNAPLLSVRVNNRIRRPAGSAGSACGKSPERLRIRSGR